MKVTLFTVLGAAAVSGVWAQDNVSATRSDACEPHGDHWHCPPGVSKPTYLPTPVAAVSTPAAAAPVSASASASASAHDDDHDHDHDHAASATTCEPHGDHWHCPSGVPKPTTPPTPLAASGAASKSADGFAVTASTCQPHGDHWHCPSGVPEPTTKPAAAAGASGSGSASGSRSATASVAQATGGAGRVEVGVWVVAGLVGGLVV